MSIIITEPLGSRNEIVDNLWIGAQPRDPYESIQDFKYVICCNGMPYYNIKPWQIVVVAPFDDCHALPPEDFLDKLATLASEYAYEGKTLVHCLAGINRSAMVTALALVKRGFSGKEAIDLVRLKRGSCLLSNEVFEEYVASKG